MARTPCFAPASPLARTRALARLPHASAAARRGARPPALARRARVRCSDAALRLPPKLGKLVDGFAAVPDAKLRYQQLLFFAKQLPPMARALKVDANLVRGCTSVVHVHVALDGGGAVRLAADSDSMLTKGMAALLVLGLDGSSAQEVLAFEPRFLAASGLDVSLTPSRNNGFLNMVNKVQDAVARLQQEEEGADAGGDAGAGADSDAVPGKPVYSAMMAKLRALRPAELELVDNSAQHAGHAGSRGLAGESHFAVRIVTDAFVDISKVNRHRMVYALLKDEMQVVHALQIEALTCGEAQR